MHIFAQEKTITLVVSGEASTKEEATKQALRSAIEQAFGTFVSANTEILNDEIIKDEIVTLTSGNITNYKEISSIKESDNTYHVTVEATVSIGKLTNYAKSKGSTAELAGASFAMNIKIQELNKKNEIEAINNLNTKLLKMGRSFYMFDYELKTGDPYKEDDRYAVDVSVTIKPNKNCITYMNTLISELDAISLSNEEVEEYKKAKLPYYSIRVDLFEMERTKGVKWHYLRNKTTNPSSWIAEFIYKESLYSFRICDNLDNNWYIFYSNNGTIDIDNTSFNRVDQLFFFDKVSDGQEVPGWKDWRAMEEAKKHGGREYEYHFFGRGKAKYRDSSSTISRGSSLAGSFGKTDKYNETLKMNFTLYYSLEELNKLNEIKVINARSFYYDKK